jgi:hypothetical protein
MPIEHTSASTVLQSLHTELTRLRTSARLASELGPGRCRYAAATLATQLDGLMHDLEHEITMISTDFRRPEQ